MEINKYDWFQRSSRQRMSPFPNYLSMESACQNLYGTFGFACSGIVLSFQKNLQTAFFDQKSDSEVSVAAMELLKKQPSILREQIQIIDQLTDDFINPIRQLTDAKLALYTNQEIADLFTSYASKYKEIYHRYFFIIMVEVLLVKELKLILSQKEIGEKIEEVFVDLTTEPEAMVNFREERDRFKIVETIMKNIDWTGIFNGTNSQILDRLSEEKHSNLYELIKKHCADYFWITRDYEDPILEIDDFISKIKVLVNDRVEYGKLLKKIENYSVHKSVIKSLEEKYNFSDYERSIFAAMRDGIYLKERRKEIVSKSLYYFDVVLSEVERRSGLSIKLVRFLKVEEVLPLLEGHVAKHDIENRFDLSFWLMSDRKTIIYSNNDAAKLEADFFPISDTDELHGMAISRGVARGVAKIMMNPEDETNIKEGDIIVTIQAVPSFSSAICRAAAIVADGGTGLTSHTATLAREAKIPGVTGVKIATKIIKDGDIIEVDGDKGIVKIIKRRI